MRKFFQIGAKLQIFVALLLIIAASKALTNPNKVAAASPPAPSVVFTVLAAGERSAVLSPTTSQNTTNNNGSEWYYVIPGSMGFAKGGDTVSLSSADVEDTNGAYRLSWHLNGTNMYAGYRAGTNKGLNYGSDWTRYIYQADTLPDYYPSGPQTSVSISSLTGWTQCYSGAYNTTVAIADLWSVCTGNYLLYAGAPAVAENKIDIKRGGTSILTAPGGTEISNPHLYYDDTLTPELYQSDGVTNVNWTHYRIYVSNCTIFNCSFPTNPLTAPGEWDAGTVIDGSYTIPQSADSKYLAVFAADDDTGAAVPGNYISLYVYHYYNTIDVTFDGTSVLNVPGGTQNSLPLLYAGNDLTLNLYRVDGVTPIVWTKFRVYISNCYLEDCYPGSPISDPGNFDAGTLVTDSTYSIPGAADQKYLAIMQADADTGAAIGENVILLAVAHTPVDRTISDCEELQEINNHQLGDHFTQTIDIDCADTVNWNTGEGFVPLGTENLRFTGTYDGAGYKISNLFINLSDTDFVGLFGVVDEGGSVSNLTLENVDITGYEWVGALSGSFAGIATNVHASGKVQGDAKIGGIVGENVPASGIGSSSSLVYTWNGTKYQYISDVGRGLPRNITGDDYTQIDANQLVAKDGKYSLKISEEYNEIVYYDELALKTFDHEPGYRVLTSVLRANDGQYFTVSENPSNPLISCTDKFGNNCLDDLKANDDKWSIADKTNTNYWTMNFGDLSGAARIQLLIQGAQDYTQANAKYVKFVQIKDINGNWVDAYPSANISTLSGAPLTKIIDLTGKFKNNNYEVRVSFNPARINYFAIDTSTQQPFTENTIHPTKVDLSFRGFTEIDKTYFWNHNYDKVSQTPPELFAKQTGFFTKYGDVTTLLQSTNDQFVIMASGDHMDVEFDYTAPEAGKARDYVLYSWVTYKHANKDTGTTVDPIPFKGMTKYPYVAPEKYPTTSENLTYLKTWNTRYLGGTAASVSAASSAVAKVASTNGKTAGEYSDGTIANSSSSVDVTGYEYVGGLAGRNERSITDSSATGKVSSYAESYYSEYFGGLVGYNSDEAMVTDCTARGDVTITSEYGYDIGGLIGYSYFGLVDNSSAFGNVSVTTTDSSGNIGGLLGYFEYGLFSDSHAHGNVTVTSEHSSDIGGFAGELYEVDGTGSSASGSVNTNVAYDLEDVGGFVGYNDSDVFIANSYASGNVTVNDPNGNAQFIGGFIGYNEDSAEISKSYATGDVTGAQANEDNDGTNRMGGFAGANTGGGNLSEDFASGNVVGGDKLGGFVGVCGGDVSDSFARGSVTGSYDLGSFAGRIGGEVYNTYATGLVTGTDEYIGGYVGLLDESINYSFWDNQTTGQQIACGNTDCEENAVGKSTALMKTQATFTTDLGGNSWNFDDIWSIKATVNDGYPFLIALDGDADGILSSQEDVAPNNGDANEDGIPDAEQSNVAAFEDPVTDQYAVLAVPENCSVITTEIHQESAHAVQDAGFNYPAGVMGYTINCGEPGQTAEINLYFFGVSSTGLVLRKFNSNNNSYTTISGAQIQEVTIGGQTATKVTYQVVDGGAFDMDGVANGTIVDPVGLARNVVGVPNTGLGGGK
ncbi:MAG: GLUG motif-containing protein [bacterium]